MRAGAVEIAAQVAQVERNLPDGVRAVHLGQHAPGAGHRADLLCRKNHTSDRSDVAEENELGPRSERARKQLDDLRSGRRRSRQRDVVELEAMPRRPLLPATAPAGMLLVS